MTHDVVVIGGGVGGMSAALALARHGRRVALVERARKVGPLLRRFRRGAVWCDGGFHYTSGLAPGGGLDVLARYFGLHDRLAPVPLDPDGFDRIITPEGRAVRFPNGMANVREALREAFPQSAGAVDAYVAEVARIHRATPFLHFGFEPREVMSLRKGGAESLAAFLARAGAAGDLAQTLGAYGNVLYGAGGEEIPLDFHAMVLGGLYESAHMLKGGGDALVGGLEAALRREGVDLVCGRAVERIEIEGRRVTGVRLAGGERLACAACIATPHPKRLAGLLAPGEAPSLLARVARAENSYGLFALFLELDVVPEAIRRSNLYRLFSPREFLAVLSCSLPAEGEKPSCVAFMPSRWDAELIRTKDKGQRTNAECSAGVSPASYSAECGVRSAENELRIADLRTNYEEYKARETERVMRALLETLPEVRGRCRVVETASPRTYEALTGTVGGAAYGIRQSVRQRPLSALTGVDGFYLAGQSILVAGVLGAMISGLVAAAHVIGIEPIWNEVRRCR